MMLSLKNRSGQQFHAGMTSLLVLTLIFFCFLLSPRALDKREYLVIIRDIFLLILHKNIHCDPSSEPSQRASSDEGSQHMV